VRVSGHIVFPRDAVPFANATVYVYVEDTTYADARADRVAAWTRRDVAYPRDAAGITFEFRIDAALPPHRRYSVRALVDVDGDGTVGPGDYLSTQAIPLRSGDQNVTVVVTRV